MHQTRSQSSTRAVISSSTTRHLKTLLILLLGSNAMLATAKSAELTEVEMVAVMEGHYHAAISGHDALIRGDIETLRSRLAKIEGQSLPTAAPKSWRPYHAELRKAAQSAAMVTDLEGAASVMVAVTEACGTCHAALGVEKIYFWPAPPDAEDTIKTTMNTHQWATERLWEGVTGPWDNAWDRGTAALAKTQIFEAGDAVTNSLRAREAALRELGQQAQETSGLHERALIYGRLLNTCAGCHQEAGISIQFAPPPPWEQ